VIIEVDMATEEEALLERVNDSFSHYKESISLIDDLLKNRRAPQEIVLLTCARLDSLANLAFPKAGGQQERFCRFISTYSGQKRFFNSISVGNLYWNLRYYSYIADGGLVELPGRIKRFGSESEIFLSFIEKCKIPITGKDVESTALRIAKVLQKYFCVMKGQKLSKPQKGSSNHIKSYISKEIRRPNPKDIIIAIDPLIDYFKCAKILYRDYRNASIHGLSVDFDIDEFFDHNEPYFSDYEYFGGELVVFHIQFPGRYLRNLLETCLNTFIKHLLSMKKFPFELFSSIFSSDEFENNKVWDYLIEDSMDEFEDVKWQLRNR
jgi:hypothetical protein